VEAPLFAHFFARHSSVKLNSKITMDFHSQDLLFLSFFPSKWMTFILLFKMMGEEFLWLKRFLRYWLFSIMYLFYYFYQNTATRKSEKQDIPSFHLFKRTRVCPLFSPLAALKPGCIGRREEWQHAVFVLLWELGMQQSFLRLELFPLGKYKLWIFYSSISCIFSI